MRAIILAAGRGSRMQHLTNDKPKGMNLLNGKTLIDHQLSAITHAGINDIAIIKGYLSEQINSEVPHTSFVNSHWATSNMVRSLTQASSWLKHHDCIISYSDIFYEASAISSLISDTHHFSITYDINWLQLWQSRFTNPLDDAETFLLTDSSFIEEIGNKTDDITRIQGQYMGLLKSTPASWKIIEQYLAQLTDSEIDQLDMTSLLQALINHTELDIKAVPYSGKWGEVDSPTDLAFYEKHKS